MQKNIKKISILSAAVFVVGFIGAFLGRSFEETNVGQKLEKKLGIGEAGTKTVETASNADCIQQEKEDNSTMFVGCNGFF